MDGGALTGLTVTLLAGGSTAILVALMLGVIWLFRVVPHIERWSWRRGRRAHAGAPAADRGRRLFNDVEGVIDLVRSDRLRATGGAEIESLMLAETLLERALARYRGESASPIDPLVVPPTPRLEAPPPHLAPSVRTPSSASASQGAG